MRSEYVRYIEHDQIAGRLPKHHDPVILADLLVGVWDGLQTQWLIDPTRDMLGAMTSFFDLIEAVA